MQNKINEQGRSMIEMLGVLAVIGVLSVAGIMGYKYGMMKYRVNETVNELNIMANTYGIRHTNATDDRRTDNADKRRIIERRRCNNSYGIWL